jgi:hypothetical protein
VLGIVGGITGAIVYLAFGNSGISGGKVRSIVVNNIDNLIDHNIDPEHCLCNDLLSYSPLLWSLFLSSNSLEVW